MAIATTYPGVYVEEIPSGVRTITGVATSITAFIGRARRGPVNKATVINNFGDFERTFGGLWEEYPMSYAVQDFYLNGGSQAVIVRVVHPNIPTEKGKEDGPEETYDAANDVAKAAADAAAQAGADADSVVAAAQAEVDDPANQEEPRKSAAEAVLTAAQEAAAQPGADADSVSEAAGGAVPEAPALRAKAQLGDLTLVAASPGEWGNKLLVTTTYSQLNDEDAQMLAGVGADELFNVAIELTPSGPSEQYLNVSVAEGRRQIDRVLENASQLMRVTGDLPDKRPPNADPAAAAAANDVAKAAADAAAQAGADADSVVAAAQAEVDDPANQEEPRKSAAEAVLTAAQEAAAQPGADADSVSEAAAGAADAVGPVEAEGGTNGGPLDANDVTSGEGLQDKKAGLYALEDADLVNLLSIPADTRGGNTPPDVYQAALVYCRDRRAMLIVDPPAEWNRVGSITEQNNKGLTDLNLTGENARNAALYFPRIRRRDPRRNGQIDTFVPSGAVAGVMARTDAQRGVWKAPAGQDAALSGIEGLALNLTDDENGMVNPLGVNVLRAFPIVGRVVWGARTMRGADLLADEYKYIPVRRTALFIEESLYRGLKWVVFEPNADPLWASIRLNVGAFMHNLFRQGAFAGTTPAKAYFVKCDGETTTQNDINLGIVNIVVGFAPLKPAEFVIIKLQQMAGQIET